MTAVITNVRFAHLVCFCFVKSFQNTQQTICCFTVTKTPPSVILNEHKIASNNGLIMKGIEKTHTVIRSLSLVCSSRIVTEVCSLKAPDGAVKDVNCFIVGWCDNESGLCYIFCHF